MASIFRGPLYSARPNPAGRRQSGEVTVAANLLLTVLAVAVVAAPFNQKDWPNPSARGTRQEAAVSQGLLQTTLATPFAQLDWQVASGRKAQGYDNPQNLLATTLAPLEQAPFAQFDWTTPASKGGVGQTNDPPNLIGTVLATAQGTPFAQVDWPNPAGRITRQEAGITQSLLQTTLGAQPPPFAQFDWQLASGRKAEAQGYDNPQNLLATTLAPLEQAPFAQFDWTTPALKGGVGQTSDPPNLIGTVLATPQGTPFAQVDWPNPLLRIRQHDSAFSQDRLATTLFTVPAGKPFSSNDWPNPPPGPAKQQGAQERSRVVFGAPAGRLIAEINTYAALSGTLDLRGPGATTHIN